MKKRCLIICYTDLSRDPRVMKHYQALKDDYDVFTAGVSAIGQEQAFTKIVESEFWNRLNVLLESKNTRWLFFLPVKTLNFLRFKIFKNFYFLRYWNTSRIKDYMRLSGLKNIDLIVSNDLNTLPLAIALARKQTKVVYDAHEYHAEEYAENPFWVSYNRPWISYLYRRYISRPDLCMTVGDNIARRYEQEYGKPFAVILNAPPFVEVKPSVTSPDKIKLVYSGMYGPTRKVDEIIRAMDLLSANYELHLLVANQSEQLKQTVQGSRSANRIYIHPAVGLREVSGFLNQFDVGVHLMSSNNFNNDNALPNKYFQYIQARLVTAFGPLSEIGAFTKEHHTGIISEDYTGAGLATALQKLSTGDINRIKMINHKNAEQFCEENEIVKLKEIYKHITL